MLHREDLDKMQCPCGCDVPGHAPRYLHSGCHMKSKVALVRWSDGAATISCGACGHKIVDIATDEPDFSLPEAPVEVFYLVGELHLGDVGRLQVAGQHN